MNKIILLGRLARDPEMRYAPNGDAVVNFSLAVDGGKAKDGNKRLTQWWRVTVWGKRAETINNYLKKGSQVLVEGRVNFDPETGGPRIWQSGERTGASFEMTATEVSFVGGKSDGESRGGGGHESADTPFDTDASGEMPDF